MKKRVELEGESILYFGPEAWDGLWRNRHQLMSRFSKKNLVVYIEPRPTIRTVFSNIKAGDIGLKELFNPLVTQITDTLYIFHSPVWTPITGKFPFKYISFAIWLFFLKRLLRKKQMKNLIVWLSRPTMGDYIGKLNEKLLIYHVVDEYTGYSGMTESSKISTLESEIEVIKKSDLVIVVSKKLLESKSKYSDSAYIVENAVDYDAYSGVLTHKANLPKDINKIKHPIIGYSGLIADRLDFVLLLGLAENNPHWNIVLLGSVDERRCSSELERLKEYKNVYLLGRKEISEVPVYMNAFNVCIIPYKTNERANNCSPLKIYEYLAMSKPVVTTNFIVAREFSNVVLVSGSSCEFEENVRLALEWDDKNGRLLEGKNIAKNNTWDKRIEQISGLIIDKKTLLAKQS